MSCCGLRRAAWRSESSLVARRTPAPTPRADAEQAPHLRCTGKAPLYLRGPSSGRAYRFGDEPVPVDAADLEALLRTGRLELV